MIVLGRSALATFAVLVVGLAFGSASALASAPYCAGSELPDPATYEIGFEDSIGGCFDDEEDNLDITITENGSKGTASILGDNTPYAYIVYTASAVGTDTVKFKANDGTTESPVFTATTNNVAPVDEPPECFGWTAMLEIGDDTNVGCIDDEGGDLTLSITQQPTKGTATIVDNGTPDAYVRYVATTAGSDTVKFKANDGTTDSNIATLTTANVAPVNDPPDCFGEDLDAAEVGGSDFVGACNDDEGDDLTITITQQGTKGTASVEENGTPDAFVVYGATTLGADTIKFKANDGTSDSTEETVATTNVPAVNDPPNCFEEGGTFEIGEAREAGSCSDDENNSLTIAITVQGTKGTATVVNQGTSDAFVRYTATALGEDTFKYKANDGTSDSNEVTVATANVAAVNDPPECFDDGGTFTIGATYTAGDCFDDEENNLTLSVTVAPTKGSTTIIGQGTPFAFVQYTPTQAGADTFSFKANDGTSDSNVVVVATNNVVGTGNHPPVCAGSATTLTIGEAREFSCTDADGNPLDYEITEQPGKGTATVISTAAGKRVRYTAGVAGTDVLRFRAADGEAHSPVATVILTNVAAALVVGTPTLPAGGSGGTVTVAKDGTATLKKTVGCLGAGPDCAVTTEASAKIAAASAAKKKKAKTVKLGKSTFKVKSDTTAKVKVKLTRKGLKLLKRLKRIKATLKITVKRGNKTGTKTIKVTFKAPKKKRK